MQMRLLVRERGNSVVVMRDCVVCGAPMRSIWVAAGDLPDVLALVQAAEAEAKSDGMRSMIYMGRRGWLRVCGYNEMATVGRKDL